LYKRTTYQICKFIRFEMYVYVLRVWESKRKRKSVCVFVFESERKKER